MSQDEAARPPYPPSLCPPSPSGMAPGLAEARGHAAFLAAACRLGPTPAAGPGTGSPGPEARLAMLAVRLDRFAHARLPLGPAISDKLRARILERARAVLPADALLQWLGEADLAIATPLHGGEPEALRLARAVADTLARPVAVGGFELFLSCSIGVALGEPGCPAERCLQRAVDTMLGVARRGGDAIASAGSVAAPPLPAAMLAALPQALERGEFAINLQPRARLDADAASVDSYTVRLRWQSAAFGRVAPQDFLPALEALGLMGDVARWILNDALPLLAAASFPVPVQFHFPAPGAQLHREHLIEELGAAIGRLGVQGARVCIEVPCPDAVRASDLLGARFEVLRRAGVQLALGDFTDTEICRDALGLLRPDLVTLDARQLGSPAQGPEVAAGLRAACALARDAGYGACAKGIETRPQLDEVRRWGCTSMQGYLLAQPFPARWLPQIHATLDQRARDLLASARGG